MENIPEENKQNATPPEMESHPAEPAPEKALNLKINLKTLGIVGAVLVVLVVAYFLKGLVIAATVNGAPISRFAVISELERVSGKQALDSLITKKLISDEAAKKGVTVSAAEISTELKKIEDNLKTQGQDLASALKAANMTQADLEKQIADQKIMEKLVADKLTVTDAEIAQYIKDYKVPVTKGKEAEANSQVKDQLTQQKLSDAANALVTTLRAAANIKYFVSYGK